MNLLVIILILVLLFGGLGYHSGWGYYGAGPYGGGLGFVVVVIIIVVLLGGFR